MGTKEETCLCLHCRQKEEEHEGGKLTAVLLGRQGLLDCTGRRKPWSWEERAAKSCSIIRISTKLSGAASRWGHSGSSGDGLQRSASWIWVLASGWTRGSGLSPGVSQTQCGWIYSCRSFLVRSCLQTRTGSQTFLPNMLMKVLKKTELTLNGNVADGYKHEAKYKCQH